MSIETFMNDMSCALYLNDGQLYCRRPGTLFALNAHGDLTLSVKTTLHDLTHETTLTISRYEDGYIFKADSECLHVKIFISKEQWENEFVSDWTEPFGRWPSGCEEERLCEILEWASDGEEHIMLS